MAVCVVMINVGVETHLKLALWEKKKWFTISVCSMFILNVRPRVSTQASDRTRIRTHENTHARECAPTRMRTHANAHARECARPYSIQTQRH